EERRSAAGAPAARADAGGEAGTHHRHAHRAARDPEPPRRGRVLVSGRGPSPGSRAPRFASVSEARRRRLAFTALAVALPLSLCVAAAAGSVALPPGAVLSSVGTRLGLPEFSPLGA